MDDEEEPLLGVRELARALNVNASTISRNFDSGLIVNRGLPGERKATLSEARAARANLDPTRLSAEVEAARAAEAIDDDDDAEDLSGAGENGAGERRSPAAADPEYLEARRERAKIGTKLAQLEYEKAAGLVISKADVEAVVIDATRILRDEMLRLGEKLAVELVGVVDPAEIQKIIDRAHRELLERLAAAFGKLGAAPG